MIRTAHMAYSWPTILEYLRGENDTDSILAADSWESRPVHRRLRHDSSGGVNTMSWMHQLLIAEVRRVQMMAP